MRLRDCTPYVSCSQGNRHRFIFKLEEIIWWLAGNNVTFTSQVALMVWWRNNRRSLKKIYDTGIGIGSPSGRSQWVIWKKKTHMTGLDQPESKMESTWFPKWFWSFDSKIDIMENGGNYTVFILIGSNRPLVIFLLSFSLAALWKRAFY